MRLGFWNRLAIVASGLALLVVPAAIWLDIARSSSEASVERHALCIDRANSDYQRHHDTNAYEADGERCWDEVMAATSKGPGWPDYWSFFLGTAAGCAIVYLMLFGITATVKWVWAGRKNTETE